MYNLLDKPFIRCFYPDGTQKELGIKETFAESAKISRIGGDSAVQEVALLRLLLAVLYRSVKDVDGAEEWEQLWNDGLPMEDIHQYLEKYRNRFEFIGGDTPFYQILGAEYEKNQEPHNKFLILSHQTLSGTSDSLYSPFKSSGLNNVGFSFAARQLVELQAFNTASKKSPIKGDTRKKKYGYAQPGWLSNGSTIHSLGRTLEQTLLLNFIPYAELENVNKDNDLPVWEREFQTAAPEGLFGDMDESRVPQGPADLYTHQSSRVTLSYNETGVTGTVVGIGDRIFKYNKASIEPMMAWRQILRETKELAFVPVKQTEGRDSWRALNALLGHNDRHKLLQVKPKILEWINNDDVKSAIEEKLGSHIPTCVTSVFYGPQDAAIKHSEVSILDLSTDILDDDALASVAATKGLKIAESHLYTFASLIANLLVAEGKEKSPSKGTKAIEIAYNGTHEILREIGAAYQIWISEVRKENAQEKLEEWNETAFRITKRLGEEAVKNASTLSIAGRTTGGNTMNAAIASNIFMGTLFKEYKIERKETE